MALDRWQIFGADGIYESSKQMKMYNDPALNPVLYGKK